MIAFRKFCKLPYCAISHMFIFRIGSVKWWWNSKIWSHVMWSIAKLLVFINSKAYWRVAVGKVTNDSKNSFKPNQHSCSLSLNSAIMNLGFGLTDTWNSLPPNPYQSQCLCACFKSTRIRRRLRLWQTEKQLNVVLKPSSALSSNNVSIFSDFVIAIHLAKL